MKKDFATFLHQIMLVDSRVWLVTADLGYKLWDDIKRDFPDRFVNTGAAEQCALGLCVGLALEDKIPVFYSISTFAILRPFETIRNYLHHEQLPIKIAGSGRDKDYHLDGYSHDASDIKTIMKPLNIMQYYPPLDSDINKLNNTFREFIYNEKPSFLSLKK